MITKNKIRERKSYMHSTVNNKLTWVHLSVIVFLVTIIVVSCKKNINETKEEEYLLSSVSKPIGTTGGSIILSNVATVYFESNTFNNNNEVRVYNTNNPTTQEDLNLAAAMFGMLEKFNYEIRINTSKVEPKKKVTIEMNLTDEFVNKVVGDLGIRGYAKLFIDDDDEKTENYDPIISNYYSSRKVLKLELEPYYFSNAWTNDKTFEAIISVGITPGINPSVGRINSECFGGSYISCPIGSCIVTSPFNLSRISPITNTLIPHKGVDFKGNVGTPVYAAADGDIVKAGYQFNAKKGTGLGNYIVISHKNSEGQRFSTLYAHLDKILETSGKVTEGKQIALSGKSGGVTGPHLHFEYITNSNIGSKEAKVDPVPYINTDLPRLKSAVGSIIGVNACSGGTRTSWQVVFNFKDPSNSINQGGELIFQDIEPISNPPYSVPVNLLNANNGTISSSTFCAKWGTNSYFKVKVFVRLSNGKESNCIYFNLPKPPGAFKVINSNNDNERPSSNKL